MVHLHLHSMYSVLDGLGKVDQIVAKAKALNAPAVAITDHGSITAMAELFKAADEANIKPIIGCEFYCVDTKEKPGKKEKEERHHLTVLAKSWRGVQSLMSQLTLANEQFYYRARLTWEQALEFEECIVMTACSFGMLAHEDWADLFLKFQDRYRGDFYVEIMPHNVILDEDTITVDYQKRVNMRAMEIWENHNANVVATNDAHYVEKEDAYTHEILLAIQTRKKWTDTDRWTFGKDPAFYMRSVQEMVEAFRQNCPYIPDNMLNEALMNTVAIVNKCNVEMPRFDVHLPSIYQDDDVIFGSTIAEGWKEKLLSAFRADPGKIREYQDRLIYEIGVIKKLDFVRYFLMVEDIIREARSKGIMVGPGRGSAAGSLVCYLMDITQVDPIEHGLIFERFLSPDRIDLPDIDIDFQDDRREEVFEYVKNKYGNEYTANINTVGILGAPSAFRDVASVFGISPIKINSLSKLIEDEESFDTVPELIQFGKSKDGQNIIEQAKKLIGTIRQQGCHACGFIVSSQVLKEVSVLEKRKDSRVVNWDKRLCEKFGLLKMDFLGLTTLTVLDQAARTIKERHGVEINFTKIPLDDQKTAEAFSRGDTVGIFQFEASGMRKLMTDVKANTFETVYATTALYRPGSLGSGETGRYTQIAQGNRYEDYLCHELKPILKPTLGVMVYQEQIMEIFVKLGGFTWAHADKMRKIIGKKLGADAFNEHRQEFVEGCQKNNVDEQIANIIFDKMVEFAKYSFNKSHAVAYSMISWWSMYLKQHYPVELCAADLTHRKNDVQLAVRDAKERGITISLPDINLSTDKYQVINDNEILAPLGIIKGVGKKAVETILAARKDGVFLNREDFVARINRRACNKRVQDILYRAGAFENLGLREPDSEQRQRNYAELVPVFNQLPSIEKGGAKIDMDAVKLFMGNVSDCCVRHKKPFVMVPRTGARASIMVINNPVKGEDEHLKNKGTKHFLNTVKELGLSPSDFYYTSAVKCYHPDQKSITKDCHGACREFLKEEIEIVRPKLIICFASQIATMFSTDKKPTMAKLAGEVIFSKEFNCYVLFSYSPQYAFYQSDIVGDRFNSAMKKISEIFS